MRKATDVTHNQKAKKAMKIRKFMDESKENSRKAEAFRKTLDFEVNSRETFVMALAIAHNFD